MKFERIWLWPQAVAAITVFGAQAAEIQVNRRIDADCISSDNPCEIVLEVSLGDNPPASMIVEEVLPPDWSITTAAWNGTVWMPTVLGRSHKWLFGIGHEVAAGELVYTLAPDSAVAPAYTVTGQVVYGSTTEPITGSSVIASCDLDEDGLPDDWEKQYFGGPTAARPDEDSDGDGRSNIEEYLADTDPTDPDCYLAIRTLGFDEGDDLRLKWSGGRKAVRELLMMPDLDPASMPSVIWRDNPPMETESVLKLNIDAIPSPRYFRVRAWRP